MITRQFTYWYRVAVVADSFDYWDVVSNISRDLKDDILNRQPDGPGNAKVVFVLIVVIQWIICGVASGFKQIKDAADLSEFLLDVEEDTVFVYKGV